MKYFVFKTQNKARLDKEIEFHYGWNNLSEKDRSIVWMIMNNREIAMEKSDIIMELDMLGVINLMSAKCK